MTQYYYGTKRVTAWSEVKDNKPGYAVKYADGYISWSPQDVFEDAYQPITAMSFGHALVALKAGQRVCRAGWNGKGMWLVLAGKDGNWSAAFDGKAMPVDWLGYSPFIAMYAANKLMVPWLASQTDMLADDWMIAE